MLQIVVETKCKNYTFR